MLNLQQAYDRFNKTLFAGRLPQVPVQFGGLSVDKAGLFQGQWYPQTKQIADGSARITISNRYQNAPEQTVLGILLHEMVHAYFYFARQFYVDHGLPFKKLLTQLASKAGIPAPMTEDLTNIDEAITTIKLGVVLINKQGSDSFVYALVDPTTLKEEAMKPAATTLLQDYADSYEAFEIESSKWSRIAMFVPIQRAGFDKLSYFKNTDGVEGWVDDVRKNGKSKLSMTKSKEAVTEAKLPTRAIIGFQIASEDGRWSVQGDPDLDPTPLQSYDVLTTEATEWLKQKWPAIKFIPIYENDIEDYNIIDLEDLQNNLLHRYPDILGESILTEGLSSTIQSWLDRAIGKLDSKHASYEDAIKAYDKYVALTGKEPPFVKKKELQLLTGTNFYACYMFLDLMAALPRVAHLDSTVLTAVAALVLAKVWPSRYAALQTRRKQLIRRTDQQERWRA